MKGTAFAHPVLCWFFFPPVPYKYHSIFPGTFCFVSSHAAQLSTSCGFVPSLLQGSFLTLLCSREGQRGGQSGSPGPAVPPHCVASGGAWVTFVVALKVPRLSALFQALWVPSFL